MNKNIGSYKLTIISLLIIFCFGIAYCEDKPIKVGTVNVETLVKNSLAFKAADLEWSRELAKKQDEMEKKKKDLDSLDQKLTTLTEADSKEKNKTQSEIDQMKVDLKFLLNNYKVELKDKEKSVFDEITKDIVKVVEDYGKANGFTYIVNESSPLVVYADINIDITAEMLTKYNQYWESKKPASKPEVQTDNKAK
jgi:outer membrane protein